MYDGLWSLVRAEDEDAELSLINDKALDGDGLSLGAVKRLRETRLGQMSNAQVN